MAVRPPNPDKVRRRGRRKTARASKPYGALLLPEQPLRPRGEGMIHFNFISKAWLVELDSVLMLEHVGNTATAHIYRHLRQGEYPNDGRKYESESPPRYTNTGRFVQSIRRSSVRGNPAKTSRTRVEAPLKARYALGPKSQGYPGMLARDGQKWGTWPFWIEKGGFTEQAIDIAFTQFVDAALAGFTKDHDRRSKHGRRLVVSGY